MEKQETPARKLVSHEYRARCMDWAIKVADIGSPPDKIVKSATAFYKYVYGDG